MISSLLKTTAQRAIAYLQELNHRSVRPTQDAIDRLTQLNHPLPDHSTDPEQVLELLDAIGSPATMAMAGSRFFGFVTGGSLPVTLAANWLAGAWDQNTGLAKITPATTALESIALQWLNDLFQFPPETGGAFVTGATMANFTALAAARNRVLTQAGWNIEADGLFGAPEIQVVVSQEVHPSLLKALGLLGLGRDRVIKVPVDDQGRMIAEKLPDLHERSIVCVQAGNVNTGSFDPIGEICDRAQKTGTWVHVDGAFGLWAAVVPRLAHLTVGMERADSWATDAHKWLNVPYDSGIAFVKDEADLRSAMAIRADYLPTSEQRNPSDYTPELSRRARGVEVWAALRSLGREGVTDLIDRTCRYAQQFAEGLRSAGYGILNDVVINQVLVSFGSAEHTLRIVAALQSEGTCWCGSTVWQGKTAMRISVSSWATTEADVEESLAAIIRVAQQV
ncbi:pyridoxal phosphate-dependent decarboxylase family protein [Leptolyngbya ohadii]|uniref:pyridoxal phosphate-dependent decarboxylase family protein n=1 Tax=Leptolyngbya ohadii TaxID=1962290 RepID=UPI0015C5DB1E|nr:pyridoxal-dependent decarboxylase [Leptolyngbya ohadii]